MYNTICHYVKHDLPSCQTQTTIILNANCSHVKHTLPALETRTSILWNHWTWFEKYVPAAEKGKSSFISSPSLFSFLFFFFPLLLRRFPGDCHPSLGADVLVGSLLRYWSMIIHVRSMSCKCISFHVSNDSHEICIPWPITEGAWLRWAFILIST